MSPVVGANKSESAVVTRLDSASNLWMFPRGSSCHRKTNVAKSGNAADAVG